MLQSSLGRVGALFAGAAAFAARFHKDTRANVVAVVALSMFPLIGALALGSEAASWNVANRGMQNAADSAAVAAATAGQSGNTAYAAEGYTVAARYGYSGSDHTLTCSTKSLDCVNVINNAACPDGTGNVCYQVTISKPRALALTQALTLIGFTGDTTVGVGSGAPAAVSISSTAVAEIKLTQAKACLIALSGGFQTNGAPMGNLGGCNIASASDVTCNGSNASINAGNIVFVTNNKNAACTPAKQVSLFVDPYAASLPSNLPPSGCTTITTLTTATIAAGGCFKISGDLVVNGTVTASSTTPTQIFVQNGNLTGSGTLVTPGVSGSQGAPAGLALVFSGSGGGLGGFGGTLNIAAPTTGLWAGIAIDDTPSTGITYTGNSPTWDVTGLVYLPNSDVTLKGAVNKAGSGYNCFVMVTKSLLISGTANIVSNPTSECVQANLAPPEFLLGFRVPLVA